MTYSNSVTGGVARAARWGLLAVGVIAAAAVFSTCGGPKPDARVVAPPSAAPPPASGGAVPTGSAATAVPAPSGGLETSGGTAASVPPAETEAVDRSTTPGKIQCETLDCDLATEVCCVDGGLGACVPRPTTADERPCGVGPQIEQRECDERADCAGEETCCRALLFRPDCSSRVMRWSCAAACGSSGPWSDEVCLRDSTCKNGPCIAKSDLVGWPNEGFCPLDTPALACGQATCKPGEKCCWDAMAGKGSCTADGSCYPPPGGPRFFELFACERPGDCVAGFDCFTSTGLELVHEYRCGHAACSYTMAIDGPFLCSELADCPVMRRESDGGQARVLRPLSCKHESAFPPGVKVCGYR